MEESTREYFRLTYAIDGKACYAEMVERGSRLASHPKVEKPHYVFSGWGEVPPRMPEGDLVIDGHFTPILYRGIFAAGVVQYGMVVTVCVVCCHHDLICLSVLLQEFAFVYRSAGVSIVHTKLQYACKNNEKCR